MTIVSKRGVWTAAQIKTMKKQYLIGTEKLGHCSLDFVWCNTITTQNGSVLFEITYSGTVWYSSVQDGKRLRQIGKSSTMAYAADLVLRHLGVPEKERPKAIEEICKGFKDALKGMNEIIKILNA